MSAQKAALVCLIVFVATLGSTFVQLLPRSKAVVIMRQHRLEVNICLGAGRDESCTLALKLYQQR